MQLIGNRKIARARHRRDIFLKEPHGHQEAAQYEDQRSDDLNVNHEATEGFRTSTIRTPELCSTMTTSPRATTRPLMAISNGSPAIFLRSTTDEGPRRRNSFTGSFRRPTSMLTVMGISCRAAISRSSW